MSKSQMPDGGYNPQLGSNYMLDGFEFDSPYGEGVDEARKDPDPDLPRSQAGLSTLPDGFMGVEASGEEFDFSMVEGGDERGLGNLGEMVRQAAPLMDLSWLEGAEQDPDRLPEAVNPVEYDLNDLYQTTVSDVPDTGMRSELEQAWGVDSRTNGQTIVPNVEYEPAPRGPESMLPGDQLRTILAHAMRKSAFGESLDNVVRDVSTFLGEGLNHINATAAGRKFAAGMRTVRAEHGVVGQVYVRDSAFPGLLTGKWDAAIKRRCASARYWLTTPGSKLAAYDRYLGMQVVTEIPWREALAHYRPRLEASGKKVASEGDPKRALLAALRAQAPSAKKESSLPVQPMGETVASDAAWAIFASAPAPERQVVRKDAEAHVLATKKARIQLGRWVKATLISLDEAKALAKKHADPHALVKAGAELVSQRTASQKEYAGSAFVANQPTKKAAETPEMLGWSNSLEVRKLLRWASLQMNEGAAGKDLDYLLGARFSGVLMKQASEPLVQLRKKHEGLAGHLYVDASAYASPSGTAGCEKGALVHRANALKAVLGMDRCGSCASNVDDHCQKYNKSIVASAPVRNAEKYQRDMIRLANGNDAEQTASYFAPSYDEGEFDLQNDSLDNFDYADAPSTEVLGEVLFEGLILDNDEE